MFDNPKYKNSRCESCAFYDDITDFTNRHFCSICIERPNRRYDKSHYYRVDSKEWKELSQDIKGKNDY